MIALVLLGGALALSVYVLLNDGARVVEECQLILRRLVEEVE